MFFDVPPDAVGSNVLTVSCGKGLFIGAGNPVNLNELRFVTETVSKLNGAAFTGMNLTFQTATE